MKIELIDEQHGAVVQSCALLLRVQAKNVPGDREIFFFECPVIDVDGNLTGMWIDAEGFIRGWANMAPGLVRFNVQPMISTDGGATLVLYGAPQEVKLRVLPKHCMSAQMKPLCMAVANETKGTVTVTHLKTQESVTMNVYPRAGYMTADVRSIAEGFCAKDMTDVTIDWDRDTSLPKEDGNCVPLRVRFDSVDGRLDIGVFFVSQGEILPKQTEVLPTGHYLTQTPIRTGMLRPAFGDATYRTDLLVQAEEPITLETATARYGGYFGPDVVTDEVFAAANEIAVAGHHPSTEVPFVAWSFDSGITWERKDYPDLEGFVVRSIWRQNAAGTKRWATFCRPGGDGCQSLEWYTDEVQEHDPSIVRIAVNEGECLVVKAVGFSTFLQFGSDIFDTGTWSAAFDISGMEENCRPWLAGSSFYGRCAYVVNGGHVWFTPNAGTDWWDRYFPSRIDAFYVSLFRAFGAVFAFRDSGSCFFCTSTSFDAGSGGLLVTTTPIAEEDTIVGIYSGPAINNQFYVLSTGYVKAVSAAGAVHNLGYVDNPGAVFGHDPWMMVPADPATGIFMRALKLPGFQRMEHPGIVTAQINASLLANNSDWPANRARLRMWVQDTVVGDFAHVDGTLMRYNDAPDTTVCLSWLGRHGVYETRILNASLSGSLTTERKGTEWDGNLGNAVADEDSTEEVLLRMPMETEDALRQTIRSLGMAERVYLYAPWLAGEDWVGVSTSELKGAWTNGSAGMRWLEMKARFRPKNTSN